MYNKCIMNNRLDGTYKCKTVTRYRVVQLSLSQSGSAAFPRHTLSACVNLIPEAVNMLHNERLISSSLARYGTFHHAKLYEMVHNRVFTSIPFYL